MSGAAAGPPGTNQTATLYPPFRGDAHQPDPFAAVPCHEDGNFTWLVKVELMCGRLDQHDINKRLAELAATAALVNRSASADRWNVPPGTYRPVMHVEDGSLVADDVFWSYRPAWAAAAVPVPPKKRIPIAINAKVEKLTGAYWKPLLRAGRGIVCADGWYEWTGPKGQRQPWHIRRRDGEPLFLLALANFGPFKEHREEAGFVLVTADSMGGMVDHPRSPARCCQPGRCAALDGPRPAARGSSTSGAQLHARCGAVRMVAGGPRGQRWRRNG